METVTLLSEYFHPSVINVYLWISSFSLSSVPPPSTKLGDEAGKRLAWQCQPHPHDLLPRGAIPSRDLLQNNRETFLERTFITSSSSPCNAVGYNQLFSKYSFLIGSNQAITPALLSSVISTSSIPRWSRRTCVMCLIRTDPILDFFYKTWSVCWPSAGGGPLTRFSDAEKLTAGPTRDTSWPRPGWTIFWWSPRC